MFFGRRKKEYRYYRNGETAFLTEGICDICGKKRKCCEGKSFEQGVQLVCSKCFGKRLASACVPPEIAMQVIGPDANEKIEDLRHTPPIVWLQNNEWPCCCNDFMTYEGIWETYVLHHKELSDCFSDFEKAAAEDPDHPIENIRQIYEEMLYLHLAYVFTCPTCGKRTILIQDEQDPERIQDYRDHPEIFRRK